MTGAERQAIRHSEVWFDERGWEVFGFQRDTWQAWHAAESGLVHSPTGSGKTLAAWLGPVQAAMYGDAQAALCVLWITPLRALANDTRENLQNALAAHAPALRAELRTGDTASGQRDRLLHKPPFALVTTPESLSVMLSTADATAMLRTVHTVVVDEWHELLGSKRGVQLQLCLARLRSLAGADRGPLRVWGLSATLSNLDQALEVLLGPGRPGRLITGVMSRRIEVDSVLPQTHRRFPWAGHLGLSLLEPVLEALEGAKTTLLFTNTRSQAELWFRALLDARPVWFDELALHHGSIDRHLREGIEARLREGSLRCVVCTSSLDLGVDFSPVDQVLQVGSPKGIARLMQRAGRSGHRPGEISRILCVPANAFELVEIAAVRRALDERRIEARIPPTRSLDVLAQHLVTIAAGTGFVEADMRREVSATYAFADLSDHEWRWVMDFITRGGQALQGYPQYRKVQAVAGVQRVMNRQIGQRHRMSIGTIASDTSMYVAFMGGKRLGSIQESFVSRLKPGDSFQFAGRVLELVRVRDMTAYVRVAKKQSRVIPRWQGTHLPLSPALADCVLDILEAWQQGRVHAPELDAIDKLLKLQMRWSALPGPEDFLSEYTLTREGYSLFCFPFAGRLAHEGIALLMASRLSATREITFNIAVNDYGFELQSRTELAVDIPMLEQALSADALLEAILHSINTDELSKRRFRDIARIAGLVFDGYPGRTKSTRQIQTSSSLLFEVLENYDRDNLLLEQARREVLESQLEYQRLAAALAALEARRWLLTFPERLTPLAFPLWTESLQSQTQTVSSESWRNRVEAMLGTLEAAAVDTLGDGDHSI